MAVCVLVCACLGLLHTSPHELHVQSPQHVCARAHTHTHTVSHTCAPDGTHSCFEQPVQPPPKPRTTPWPPMHAQASLRPSSHPTSATGRASTSTAPATQWFKFNASCTAATTQQHAWTLTPAVVQARPAPPLATGRGRQLCSQTGAQALPHATTPSRPLNAPPRLHLLRPLPRCRKICAGVVRVRGREQRSSSSCTPLPHSCCTTSSYPLCLAWMGPCGI